MSLETVLLCSTLISTYINEVLGVEDVRDLVAEQILFSPPQPLDVDVLDNHLQR